MNFWCDGSSRFGLTSWVISASRPSRHSQPTHLSSTVDIRALLAAASARIASSLKGSRRLCGGDPCGGTMAGAGPASLSVFVQCDPAVDVFQTLDVVLAQIATGLHLDQLQRNLAGVAQAMNRRHRDEGRLILREQEGLLVTGDLGGAGHHNPVLGAMVVHLQRETGAGVDGDVLDLETLADMH